MKVKIKGLVFVGFAAAILSANAMADDTNTVTSKSYVDNKFQVLDGIQTAITDSNKSSETLYPSMKALTDGLDAVEDKNTVTGVDYVEATVAADGTTVQLKANRITSTGDLDTASDNLVTENVIANAVNAKLDHNQGSANSGKILVINESGEVVPSSATGANTYQSKSTNATLPIADGAGGWTTLKTKVIDGTYVEAAEDSTTKALTVDIKAAQINSTGTGTTALTADSSKLATEGVIKAYVDAKTAADQNVYQDRSTGTQIYNVSDGNGGWTALNSTVTVTNGTATGGSNGATTQAIVDYVQSQTHGNVIPEQNSQVCGTIAPCALVNEGTALHWYTMATATHAGGTCGDATGNCQ